MEEESASDLMYEDDAVSASDLFGVNDDAISEGIASDLFGVDDDVSEGIASDLFGVDDDVSEGIASDLFGVDDDVSEGIASDLFGVDDDVSEGIASDLFGVDDDASEGIASDLFGVDDDAISASDLFGLDDNAISEYSASDLFGLDDNAISEYSASDLFGVNDDAISEYSASYLFGVDDNAILEYSASDLFGVNDDTISASDLFDVDDSYPSAIIDENKDEIFLVSDSKCTEELQFQKALTGSVVISQMENKGASSSSSSSLPKVEDNPTPTQNPESVVEETKEGGESSHSFCEICVEKKESGQMFRNESCVHSFCSDCISKHVTTKIQDSIIFVSCPGLDCKGIVELNDCSSMLPKEVLERWNEKLCQALFLPSQKFYCPFKDCSAMLVNDKNDGKVIRESECPYCHRMFCVQCNVPWHPGVECEEFQRLNEDERGKEDLMVRELAREKKWKRCPHCKYYVEKTEGCLHITCRCGFQFCYGCGAQWVNDHDGDCQRD